MTNRVNQHHPAHSQCTLVSHLSGGHVRSAVRHASALIEISRQPQNITQLSVIQQLASQGTGYDSPLHYAVSTGDHRLVRRLLKLECLTGSFVPSRYTDQQRGGLITIAARRRDFDVVRLLFDHIVNVVNRRSNTNIAQLRQCTIDVAATGGSDAGMTALYYAARFNKSMEVDLLLGSSYNASIDGPKLLPGRDTLLHIAVTEKHVYAVELLLYNNVREANIHATNSGNQKPIDLLESSFNLTGTAMQQTFRAANILNDMISICRLLVNKLRDPKLLKGTTANLSADAFKLNYPKIGSFLKACGY